MLVIRPKKGWTLKRRFSVKQIIGIIKEYEAGVKAQDLCRKYGISDATFYKYKAKFGGMNMSDAKKLRALEDENNRLKRRTVVILWAFGLDISPLNLRV